jgi:hypothetical protein
MKTAMTLSIEKEDYDLLKGFCEQTGLTTTKLYETYTRSLVNTIKATGWTRSKRLSKIDVVRLLGKGLMQET